MDLNELENEEIYVDVYVPFTDLEIAQLGIAKKFSELGYDIYAKAAVR